MYANKWDGNKKTSFYGLSQLQLQILSKFIQDHQNAGGVRYFALVDVHVRLREYAACGFTLVGMYNYLIWCLSENDKGQQRVANETSVYSDIAHDLNGMHDRSFSPRTSQYENWERLP